jgi:DNA-binding FadR family transcriptional regulator
VVMLASLRGPILRLIRTSVESDLDEARSRILSAHGRIVEAIRRQDGMTAEHESKQHLFELYMKLIPAGERARMQALLG